jgi:hypothetical protein
MAEKKKTAATMVRIKNLQDGPRTYPLKDGSSVHLPGKYRGAEYPLVSSEQVGVVLEDAAKKGFVLIEKVKGGDVVGAGNAESDMD